MTALQILARLQEGPATTDEVGSLRGQHKNRWLAKRGVACLRIHQGAVWFLEKDRAEATRMAEEIRATSKEAAAQVRRAINHERNLRVAAAERAARISAVARLMADGQPHPLTALQSAMGSRSMTALGQALRALDRPVASWRAEDTQWYSLGPAPVGRRGPKKGATRATKEPARPKPSRPPEPRCASVVACPVCLRRLLSDKGVVVERPHGGTAAAWPGDPFARSGGTWKTVAIVHRECAPA